MGFFREVNFRSERSKDVGYKLCIHLPSSDGREVYDGEFDPGSERTLAARFKHASRRIFNKLAF